MGIREGSSARWADPHRGICRTATRQPCRENNTADGHATTERTCDRAHRELTRKAARRRWPAASLCLGRELGASPGKLGDLRLALGVPARWPGSAGAWFWSRVTGSPRGCSAAERRVANVGRIQNVLPDDVRRGSVHKKAGFRGWSPASSRWKRTSSGWK